MTLGRPSVRDAPTADAPRISQEADAREPCHLPRLPAKPTYADLEIGYAARGAEILACDIKRALAVAALDREHKAEDAWKEQRDDRRAPWWQFWR